MLRSAVKTGGIDKPDGGLGDTFQQQGRVGRLYRAALMVHPNDRAEMGAGRGGGHLRSGTASRHDDEHAWARVQDMEHEHLHVDTLFH